MTKTEAGPEGYFKKEVAIIAVVAALAAGFIGGVIYSSLNTSGSGSQVASQQQNQPMPPQDPGFSPEIANEILALQMEVTKNPNNLNAWTRLGNLYFDSDQFEQSVKAYLKSLALNPDDVNVRTDMGVMYRRNRQPQEALAAFEEVIRRDPGHQIARFNKGVVLHFDLHEHEEAIKAWEELLKVNPNAKAPDGTPIQEVIDQARIDANHPEN